MSNQNLPAIFITHGGGPYPILNPQLHSNLYKQLNTLRQTYKPKALIVFSAHWEQDEFSIIDDNNPGLLYDYYGFPKESYSLKWQANSTPQLRNQVKEYLKNSDVPLKSVNKRGYDHGVFIPLMIAYPKADVPVIQISLLKSLNPQKHYKMGQAINGLRKQGYLIVGSGSSFHNMSYFMGKKSNEAQGFDDQLTKLCCKKTTVDDQLMKIKNWSSIKYAKISHPREEHLVPLFIILGCSNGEAGQQSRWQMLNVPVSNFTWR